MTRIIKNERHLDIMKQCDYCGNYGEGLETVAIDCYYSDGSSETVDLCPEHLPSLHELYPPCDDNIDL